MGRRHVHVYINRIKLWVMIAKLVYCMDKREAISGIWNRKKIQKRKQAKQEIRKEREMVRKEI